MPTIASTDFSLGFHLIDIFSRHLSFYYTNCKNKKSKATHIHNLDKCVFNTSTDSKPIVVVSDASIKNKVTISIVHVYSFLNPIKKTIHHAVNITTTEAKLFAIRCGIN